ncbi:MAG: hypothetical protein H7A40_06845 [Chlamydiales bacterium]|nr:hypothetical protein [Chlamydiales bacterium]
MIKQIYSYTLNSVPKCVRSLMPSSLSGRIPCIATLVFASVAFYYASKSYRLNQFKLELDQWVKQEGGESSLAAEKILHCYENGNKTLSLVGLQLKTLPACLRLLTGLDQLNLAQNRLESLPEELSNLKNLTILLVSGNLFKSLPDCMGKLKKLRRLYASKNQLESLSESLCELKNLKWFHAEGNMSLTSIPESWLTLSRDCAINLEGTSLSERYIQHLREITKQEGYNGPRIEFSTESGQIRRPLKELLAEIYEIAECDQPAQLLTNASEFVKGSLRDWLSRLSDTYEYRNGGAQKKAGLAKKITEYLELADKNKTFYDAFISLIEGETNTCGDRIALSIMRLGVMKRLVEFDMSDMKGLAELLKKGVWTIGLPAGDTPVTGLLEQCALEKMKTMRLYDDVEVILAYPVKLKEALDLPVDIEDMLFYRYSYVTEGDIDAAKAYTQMMWENQEEFHQFLIGQEKWCEALKHNYPNYSPENALELAEKALQA